MPNDQSLENLFQTFLSTFFVVSGKKVKSLSFARLFATPWTVAYQAPPSMGFSRQEYWSGVPLPSPGALPNSGIKPGSPTFQADALTSEHQGSPLSGKRVNLSTFSHFGWKSKPSVFCGQISLPFCFLKNIYFYSFSWLCLVLFAALRIFVAACGIFSYDI